MTALLAEPSTFQPGVVAQLQLEGNECPQPYTELWPDQCLQIPELLLPTLSPDGSAERAALRLLGYSWGPGGEDALWKTGLGCVCGASLLGKSVLSD